MMLGVNELGLSEWFANEMMPEYGERQSFVSFHLYMIMITMVMALLISMVVKLIQYFHPSIAAPNLLSFKIGNNTKQFTLEQLKSEIMGETNITIDMLSAYGTQLNEQVQKSQNQLSFFNVFSLIFMGWSTFSYIKNQFSQRRNQTITETTSSDYTLILMLIFLAYHRVNKLVGRYNEAAFKSFHVNEQVNLISENFSLEVSSQGKTFMSYAFFTFDGKQVDFPLLEYVFKNVLQLDIAKINEKELCVYHTGTNKKLSQASIENAAKSYEDRVQLKKIYENTVSAYNIELNKVLGDRLKHLYKTEHTIENTSTALTLKYIFNLADGYNAQYQELLFDFIKIAFPDVSKITRENLQIRLQFNGIESLTFEDNKVSCQGAISTLKDYFNQQANGLFSCLVSSANDSNLDTKTSTSKVKTKGRPTNWPKKIFMFAEGSKKEKAQEEPQYIQRVLGDYCFRLHYNSPALDNNESYRNDSKRFRDKFSGAKLIAAKSKGKAGIKKSKTNDEMFEFKIPNSGIRLIGKIAGKVTIDGKEYQLVNFNSVCNKNKASRQLRK